MSFTSKVLIDPYTYKTYLEQDYFSVLTVKNMYLNENQTLPS